MEIINSKRFGLFCLLMFLVTGVYGQKWRYPRVENGNTIISRDAAGGIKVAALLTEAQKKYLIDKGGVAPKLYYENSEYNRVSAKFQVAPDSRDLPTLKVNWLEATTYCRGYSINADKSDQQSWRLPTIRELMLISIFKESLTNCGDITTMTSEVWSGTSQINPKPNSNDPYACYVEFGLGVNRGTSQSDGYYVRCVRDL